MEWPTLVTAVALLEYMFFTFKVGFSRNQYEVHAPAISGHPVWERLYRVQQNTLEQLIVFIPSLWMFCHFYNPAIGALIGCAFVVGRAIYFVTYVKDPKSRALGFVMGFLSNVVLTLGSIVGALLSLAT